MESEARREQWERRSQVPLIAAALLFLLAFAWPVVDRDLSEGARLACEVVIAVTWAALAVDYVVRLVLSVDRWRFVRGHVLDLLVVVLPLLRPLVLVRVLLLLGVLNRRTSAAFHGRVAIYIVTSLFLVLFAGAVLMLQVERGSPDASITSFGDALWWALATVTTVGYGDEYPTTEAGRFVAAALMLGGIALLGAVTASGASWLVHRFEQDEEATSATRADVRRLTAEVTALREEVVRLRQRTD